MKTLKVLTKGIVRLEEHGVLVTHYAGEVLALPRRLALELAGQGDVELIEQVRAPAPPEMPEALPMPWEARERRKALEQRIEEAQAKGNPPFISGASGKWRKRRELRNPDPLVFQGTSELLERARAFWYNNEPAIRMGGLEVTRGEVWTYGGPSPQFNRCPTCQGSEWLSRLLQGNLFEPHGGCPTAGACEALCRKQGDERYTQVHQNHWFLSPCDPKLNAPQCVCVLNDRWYDVFFQPGGSHVTINKRRAFARAFQADMYRFSQWREIDWDRYDLLYLENSRNVPLLPRPDIPILMYGHDHWKGNPQEALDHYRPDVLLTPFPYLWKRNVRIPGPTETWGGTRVELYAAGASTFFTRPNTDPARKAIDLLCIGALSKGPDGPYGPRMAFHEQVLKLPARYKVGHMHAAQFGYAHPDEPLGEARTMLNAYSERLGQARYVAFAPCQGMAEGGMWIKYYECLGSGAIPIVPEIPDLDLLGVRPGVHYIPYAEVEGNNARLAWYLDHYEEHRHIGEAAAAWHAEHADDLLFGGFERVVRSLTGKRYPARDLPAHPAPIVGRHPGPQMTFITIPREWVEPYRTRQENAIGSWMRLDPQPYLALFCDDPGTADAAARWGAAHVADGARNEHGTPRVDDVFLRGQQLAREAGAEVVVYCNTDVILGAEFARAVRLVAGRFEQFLIVGARWDVDWTELIDYDDPQWQEKLLAYVKAQGKRHSQGALDYFAFRPGLYQTVPPFAVGRSAWDNWLVCEANYLGAHTVDAGAFVMAVHQNIPPKKRPPTEEQVEKQRNWALYAARHCAHQSGSANNCRWVMRIDGTLEERPGKAWRP